MLVGVLLLDSDTDEVGVFVVLLDGVIELEAGTTDADVGGRTGDAVAEGGGIIAEDDGVDDNENGILDTDVDSDADNTEGVGDNGIAEITIDAEVDGESAETDGVTENAEVLADIEGWAWVTSPKVLIQSQNRNTRWKRMSGTKKIENSFVNSKMLQIPFVCNQKKFIKILKYRQK